MSEYINREAAIEIAEKYGLTDGSVLGRHSGVGECISSEIAALPAADVVPVVRCKECKHLFYTMCAACGFLPHKPNDFCSYGERKDGGADNE
jgi:hypothetical protein